MFHIVLLVNKRTKEKRRKKQFVAELCQAEIPNRCFTYFYSFNTFSGWVGGCMCGWLGVWVVVCVGGCIFGWLYVWVVGCLI